MFIQLLIDEQHITELAARHARQGILPPRRRKWRALEARIRSLKRQFEDGRRNINEYWDAISYAVRDFT